MPGILLIQCADMTQTYHMESGVVTAPDHGLHNIHEHEFITIRNILSHLCEVIKSVIFVTHSPRIAGYAHHTLRFDDRRVTEAS